MNSEQAVNHQVSIPSKIGYGILLPLMIFIVYQFILIGSQDGTGSWDGMSLFFGSLFIVPGLLIANCWVIPIRWSKRRVVFLTGLGLPAVIGAVEFFWLFGPHKLRWAINSTMVAPFPWIWLFVVLLFSPLLISVIGAIRRRLHGDKK